MKEQYEVILLHPKGMLDEEVNNYRMAANELIEAAMVLKGRVVPFYITPASDDWKIYGHVGYEKWCNGLHERYNAAITITRVFGKATSRIISSFIQNNRPIRLLDNNNLLPVIELITIDDTDWLSGWSVKT